TYGVCLPLGVLKAIKHRTLVDNLTSILIFVGYSIPGFALGGVLLVYLGAQYGWFPMIGLDSPELADLPWWSEERLWDRAHHTVLPLICYVVGSFAWMTMMMKNNLMDNLAADYVRTAVAKGAGWRKAVFKHAFRNSFIPIATSLGQLITILVGGSMLIEKVFDIQGFGLLQFQALFGKDYPVVMGTLTIAAFLMIIGNILSDVVVAMVDPRVKFN
ncbi:MAG: ABC transporter permease, partial [Verrucomicrobiota bacterium]